GDVGQPGTWTARRARRGHLGGRRHEPTVNASNTRLTRATARIRWARPKGAPARTCASPTLRTRYVRAASARVRAVQPPPVGLDTPVRRSVATGEPARCVVTEQDQDRPAIQEAI